MALNKNQLELIKRLEKECEGVEFEQRKPKTQAECSEYIDYLKLKAGKLSHFHRSFMRDRRKEEVKA